MKTAAALIMLMAMLWMPPAGAGTVQVSFDQPERFTDTGHGRDADEVLQVIDRHLQALGQAGLPAGQTLKITVTDIDLAGSIRPWLGRFADVRVLDRAVDWPRIDLQYTLSQGDRVIAQGSEHLADLAYTMRPPHPSNRDRLPYEQRLLSAWFAERFGPDAASR